MKSRNRYSFLAIFLFLSSFLFGWNYFSPLYNIERFYIDSMPNQQQLEHDYIIVNSERVFKDSNNYVQDVDYQIDYATGIIIFLHPLKDVFVEYQFYPGKLKRRFFLYEEIEYQDSVRIEKIKKKRHFLYSDNQLNVTGNKTISISVANDDDFNLDQSLFLRLNGRLAKNLYIEGQLSDSQSPITPEGDSREISSLDQIFLRVYNSDYELALGDLEMEYKQTDFFNYTPKFEGLKVARLGNNNIHAALAVAKGKRATYNFSGIEGKQGPYYISVENISGVQIVPGSELVFLNGEEIFRGTDYTIDYSDGSMIFTNNHFISSTTKLKVNFQYTDEQYRQNLYLVSSSWNITENLRLTPQIIWQTDDKNNPLLEDYSEDDIALMKAAGDSTVWGSGVFYIEDGSGHYNYNEEEDFYYYVGADSQAIGYYNLRFTYIGSGKGFYNKAVSGDYYYYTGIGGDYLLARRLQTPESQGNVGLELSYEKKGIAIDLEGIITSEDQNLWSSNNDDNNDALAGKIRIYVKPDWDRIEPSITIQQRNWQENLALFSELNTPAEIYDLENTPDSLATKETTVNSEVKLFNRFTPGITLKYKDVDHYLNQHYLSLYGSVLRSKYISILDYKYIQQGQNYHESLDRDRSEIVRHNLNWKLNYRTLYFSGYYLIDKNEIDYKNDFNLGLKQDRYKLTLGLQLVEGNNIEIYWEEEKSDTLVTEDLWLDKQAISTFGTIGVYKREDFFCRINLAHRKIDEEVDQEYDLAEISFNKKFLSHALNVNGNYELQNVEFYPKLRELEFVGEELGIYDSLGFVSEEGEYDFVVTSIDYDNPKMSVQVNANTSIDIDPGRITDSFWRNLKSETYLLINENSTSSHKRDIYILNPNYIRTKEYTLYGRYIINQNFRVNIIPGKLNGRFNYEEEEILDQRYNDNLEVIKRDNYGGLLRLLKVAGFNWEIELERSQEADSRHQLNSISYTGQLSAKTNLNRKFSMKTTIDYSKEEGDEHGVENSFQLKSFVISELVTYFGEMGFKLTGKFQYKKNYRSGYNFTSYIDKQSGNIAKWALTMNYQMNSFTYLTIGYSGDSYPNQKQKHKFSMEIKAEL